MTQHIVRYHNNTMINFLAGVTVSTGRVAGAGAELWVAPAHMVQLPTITCVTCHLHLCPLCHLSPVQVVSTLTIHQTRPDHAGNYTCAPPHAASDTVRLYVAQGDQQRVSGAICHKYFQTRVWRCSTLTSRRRFSPPPAPLTCYRAHTYSLYHSIQSKCSPCFIHPWSTCSVDFL